MAATNPEALRCLVACPSCRRQYDAGGLAAGSRFRCGCGKVVEVPRFQAQDAAVVRCSSCSAPRQRGARSCAHCGADYTLHEQDMRTVCPGCMTRVSDRARYCHNCGTPIVPLGRAGAPTDSPCPACGRASRLNSRALGNPPLAVLECPGCAGLWLRIDGFRVLVDRARDTALGDPGLSDPGARVNDGTSPAPVRAAESRASFYRPCPECGKMMNRRNFGQASGVLVDACKEHGLWFDATELSSVLKWISRGGEKNAAERRAEEERHAERLARLKVKWPTQAEVTPGVFGAAGADPRERLEDRLGDLLGQLFGF